jgi:dienelactone hydrolase
MTPVLVGPSIAAELAQPAGLVREPVMIPFVQFNGNALKLEAVVTRPAAPGRYPLALLNHGSPRSSDARMNSASSLTAAAIEFALRGWAVATVARRGYGRSEGVYAEDFDSCANPNYEAAGFASAQDIIQSTIFLQSQAYVDPDRLLLIGESAGGFGSLASASLSPRGLAGVINFAGGRGSPSTNFVCHEERLIAAVASYGRSVRVPTLWVYSENDHFFGPTLAREMFSAFTAGGAAGELVIVPAFGNDGHYLLSPTGIPRWRNLVDTFLRKHHLPTWAEPIAIPIVDLSPPTNASADELKVFQNYLASQNYEKAFMRGAAGHFTWVSGRRTAEDAVADALKECERAGFACEPYAINDLLAEPIQKGRSVDDR